MDEDYLIGNQIYNKTELEIRALLILFCKTI